ncbi:myxosortase-dependent M36 family metallopeptidase [Hyalangium rubrum]|uniref:Myxosortase-dependent M36 family metallopeptidase n=1 Tax=Hyalangium rubrum TaxID=3103134 RepID=A0ABU5H2X4_9BACT|nr:myxosortase-dependent M36 family metallopeptidase [Hyalangium sp. s54d21]MDY7227454.1 myxosortase-dependent M36 family metallopeptidase [Hyalangium sp. s54d21]
MEFSQVTHRTVALVGLALATMAAPAFAARQLPTVDAFTSTPLPLQASSMPERAKGLHVVSEEPRLGVPTFAWGVSPPVHGPQLRRPVTPEEAARAYLNTHVGLYRLSRTDAAHIPVRGVHRMREGASIVSFAQEVEGIEVFRQSLKVLLDSDNQLVAMSGYLSPAASAPRRAGTLRFTLTPPEAIALAWSDLHGEALPASSLRLTGRANGPYSHYALSPGPRQVVFASPARVRQTFFPLPGALVPAYYVELDTTPVTETDGDHYAYVISAEDGRLLYRHDLTAHQSFTYRVWADAQSPHVPYDGPQGTEPTPHPTGFPDNYQAPFVSPNLITLQNVPYSRNDPWLPAGATQTTGNNVEAYTDYATPNGFSAGDIRASVSAPNTFGHAYDVTQSPTLSDAQQMSSVTQLFFVTNFLHDWYYDFGFDEASGNSQMDNFGRGGLGGDSLLTEAQDFSGRNNANMSTPADGGRPRMQMFMYDTRGLRVIDIPEGHPSVGRWTTGTAAFGPTQFSVTAAVVVAQDGVAGPSSGTVADACEPLTNGAEVLDKLVLVDRAGCAFTLKAANVQAAGAAGVIIANSATNGASFHLAGRASDITIPVLSVGTSLGNALRSQPPASVTVIREAADRDGALDNTIVAHEWTHYMSNRLIGNANGLTNNQGRSMGEGWSDFAGLLMLVREGDNTRPWNVDFGGVYARAAYASSGGTNQGYYWGNRRYPYTTDMTKNPMTLRYMELGVPLPADIPVSFGADGASNAEVHASGELWAVMLWECYASLLRDTPRYTFAQAQAQMKEYLVSSLKLTPNAPTFLEARDALLAAAYANDPADYVLFARAFAKRGAGPRAVAPHRDSTDHVGVVESFQVGKDVTLASVELLEQSGSTASCDDDGVLDTGETARVRVTLRNSGIGALSRTSMTLSSNDPDVSFPSGATVALPASEPLQLVSVELPVKLSGAATQRNISLTVAYRDEEQVVPGDQTHTVVVRVNTDEIPASSTLETVEAAGHPWLLVGSTAPGILPWKRQANADNTGWFFYGPDNGRAAEILLVSPPLQVASTGDFRFTFQHRYDFELGDDGVYYDGGVIELSEDNGSTWVELNGAVRPSYNALISTGGNNPIEGKQAYGGQSAGYPAFSSASVELGTLYAGKTVLIRFRIGTDLGVGAPGWEVDDLQFEGIVNTPFATVLAHRGQCINRVPVVSAGADQTINERRRVTLSGSATDPEGAPLTYVWTQTVGPAVTLSGASEASSTFRAPEVTEDTDLRFELRASDGVNTSPPAQVTVRVRNISNGNRPPSAQAQGPDAVDEGASVTLTGGGTDPDEDVALVYAWTQVSGPTVTLSDAASSQVSFTAPQVPENKELRFQLVVSDGELSSEPVVVTVQVRDVFDAKPVARAGEDQSVKEGNVVTLSDAGSTDPEGTPLTYAWTQVEGPTVTLTAQGARATFTAPGVDADTVLTFQLRVTDTHGESSEDTVSVNVANVPEPDSGCGCGAGQDGSVPATLVMLLAAVAFATRRRRA